MLGDDSIDKINFNRDDNILEDNYDGYNEGIVEDNKKPIFNFEKTDFQKHLIDALNRVKYIDNTNSKTIIDDNFSGFLDENYIEDNDNHNNENKKLIKSKRTVLSNKNRKTFDYNSNIYKKIFDKTPLSDDNVVLSDNYNDIYKNDYNQYQSDYYKNYRKRRKQDNDGISSIASEQLLPPEFISPINDVNHRELRFLKSNNESLLFDQKQKTNTNTRKFVKICDKKDNNKLQDKNNSMLNNTSTRISLNKEATTIRIEGDPMMPYRQINDFVNNLFTLVNKQKVMLKEFGLNKKYIKPFYDDKNIKDKLLKNILECKDSMKRQSCCKILPELNEFLDWLLT